jgi:hypothetical protein
MQQHTEGEWYVAPSGLMVQARNDAGPHPIVAHVSLTRGNAEAVANAALIAAAPAMRAALKAQQEHDDHVAGCHLCKSTYRNACVAGVTSRAVAERLRLAALKQARQGQEQGVAS